MVATVSFGTQMFFTAEGGKRKRKNDVEGIVRLCDYMLILHFEDKCAAELIMAEPISDIEGGWGRKKQKAAASFMAL